MLSCRDPCLEPCRRGFASCLTALPTHLLCYLPSLYYPITSKRRGVWKPLCWVISFPCQGLFAKRYTNGGIFLSFLSRGKQTDQQMLMCSVVTPRYPWQRTSLRKHPQTLRKWEIPSDDKESLQIMDVYKCRKHWNTSVSPGQLLDYNMLYISLAVSLSEHKIQWRIILVLIFFFCI